MTSVFSAVQSEFDEELEALSALILLPDASSAKPKTRVAAANAAVLLLAATFEEFVREMARAYAKEVVRTCESYERLPPKLAAVAWKRTMEALARVQLNPKKEAFSKDIAFSDAMTKFKVVYEFCRGDISQDIYLDLIHNDNNMRPNELNGLFKLSGLSDVCKQICSDEIIQKFIEENDADQAHGLLLGKLESFFEKRNQIAHSISLSRSSAPEQISIDIQLMRCFGTSLRNLLEAKVSDLQ